MILRIYIKNIHIYTCITRKIIIFADCKQNRKNKIMRKMTKEEFLSAIKKAKENKEKARQKTATEWLQKGIKGNVILI